MRACVRAYDTDAEAECSWACARECKGVFLCVRARASARASACVCVHERPVRTQKRRVCLCALKRCVCAAEEVCARALKRRVCAVKMRVCVRLKRRLCASTHAEESVCVRD